MRVRPARGDDREALLALRCALWPELEVAHHERELRRRADTPARFETLVLESGDGRVNGFLELHGEPTVPGEPARVVLEALFVAPPLRGQGAARQMLAAADRWARGRGAAVLECELDAGEHTLLEALAGLGFGEARQRVRVRRALDVPMEVAAPAGDVPPAETAREPELVVQPVRPAGGSAARVFNLLMLCAAVASFAFTDIYAPDALRGVLLPLLDVGFVLYFLGLFVVLRYRKRANSADRAEKLFRRDS